MKKTVLGITATLLVSAMGMSNVASAHSAQHSSELKSERFKSSDVTEHIVMLQGEGGNLAVLTGEQGLLMVDSDYDRNANELEKIIQQFKGHALEFVINTHWHGDHSGGNAVVGKQASIIAHDNVRKRLSVPQEIKLFNMVSEPYPEHALPSLTYNDRMTLHRNGEEIQLVHFPKGHTDGDTVVFFRNANVVHMGDLYFSNFFPFVDIGTGGNVVNYTNNVGKVLELIDDNTKIIPGHGPLSSKTDLKTFHKMLQGTTEEVRKMKQEGLTLAQAQKQGLSEQWKSFEGFIKTPVWIGFVWQSL